MNLTKFRVLKIKIDFSLTNGVFEALSFHTANSPRDAKKLKPPQSQANASYWNIYQVLKTLQAEKP